MYHLICFVCLCSVSDNQISLFDNQEAEINLKIRVKNTSGRAITLLKSGTIPRSLVCMIQEISSINTISFASNEEGEEEKMNIAAGNYVDKQVVDSMEYESYHDNLMEDDSQEQWTHHMNEQTEHMQSKTPPVLFQISEQQSSQIKEHQRSQK